MRVNEYGKFEIRVWHSLASISIVEPFAPTISVYVFDTVRDAADKFIQNHMDIIHNAEGPIIPLDWLIRDWARLRQQEIDKGNPLPPVEVD